MRYLQIKKSDLVNAGDFSDETPLSDVGDCNGKNKFFWNLYAIHKCYGIIHTEREGFYVRFKVFYCVNI